MERVDRRTKRSQRLLGDALVSLILEKGYESITNKDITERADVAYVTFYRHYKDKDELLNQVLENSLGRLMDRMAQAAREANEFALNDQEGELIFAHVIENAALYRILLGSHGASNVRKRIKDAIAAIFLESCKWIQVKGSLLPGEIAANHVAASLLALIEWWLEHGQPYPIQRMGQIYSQLIIQGTIHSVSPDKYAEMGG
jgi:AcrR family transcriptional regulator